jgi:hypothetical protein
LLLANQDYDPAISQFKRGWELGDDQSLLSLGALYTVTLQRYQDVKPLIPDLIKVYEVSADTDDKHEISNILIAYAINANAAEGKRVFLTAVDGLSDAYVFERDDTAKLVIFGFKRFGYQDRAERLESKMASYAKSNAFFREGVSKYRTNDYYGAIASFNSAIQFISA